MNKKENRVPIYPGDRIWIMKEAKRKRIPVKKMINNIIEENKKKKKKNKPSWELGDYDIRI